MNIQGSITRFCDQLRRREIISSLEKAGTWFVDVPRTSSTSIKSAMEDKYGNLFSKTFDREKKSKLKTLIPDHLPARNIIEICGEDVWKSIFTFSVVRNPWDRFWSLYQYRIVVGDLSKSITFNDYVKKLEVTTYRKANSPFHLPHYHMSQCDFLLDANDKLLVDRVYKMEQRQELVDELIERLQVDISTIVKERISGKVSYKEAYDPWSRSAIADYYREDIEYFGYEF